MVWKYKYHTDIVDYCGADSGCAKASTKLGCQSICLVNCPFDKCVLWGKNGEGDVYLNGNSAVKVAELMAEGKSPGRIAVELGLPWQCVLDILRNLR